ncbi:ribonuclease domain-containing protein [Kitasatospora sp. NBC_01539]|uniref:ribonuclease domain-containing protein n=1 Tax=Kitasatospora sp. NBC_01539 TaxID=2903577 RepID=UPI00386028D5
MSSRSRSIAVAVLLVCGIVVAAAYALYDRSPAPAPTAQPPVTTPAAAGSPRSSPAGPAAVWIPDDPAVADVCRTRLPVQADTTLVLITRGGPYPYRSDGIVFENREGLLPRHGSGYYHEYTVVTPGSGDRGTRRIVTGGAGEQYWTADHYASFREIDPRC